MYLLAKRIHSYCLSLFSSLGNSDQLYEGYNWANDDLKADKIAEGIFQDRQITRVVERFQAQRRTR